MATKVSQITAVPNHVSAIFAKLQVADRNEAIILARDAGLGRAEPAS
jgi:DNA-binding NarL/FixJ family response regulator